jgi:hypothetical protein
MNNYYGYPIDNTQNYANGALTKVCFEGMLFTFLLYSA